MIKIRRVVSLLLFLAVVVLPAQDTAQEQKVNYYRVDHVITVNGEIIDIKAEKCYNNNDFIIIYLKEKKSGEVYRVEVSPQWFFTLDLLTGSKIEVTGSYNKMQDTNLILTQAITFRGENSQFRDNQGFPLWRGKGKHMKTGQQGKGKRKRGRY
jgi:hypothetical protein